MIGPQEVLLAGVAFCRDGKVRFAGSLVPPQDVARAISRTAEGKFGDEFAHTRGRAVSVSAQQRPVHLSFLHFLPICDHDRKVEGISSFLLC